MPIKSLDELLEPLPYVEENGEPMQQSGIAELLEAISPRKLSKKQLVGGSIADGILAGLAMKFPHMRQQNFVERSRNRAQGEADRLNRMAIAQGELGLRQAGQQATQDRFDTSHGFRVDQADKADERLEAATQEAALNRKRGLLGAASQIGALEGVNPATMMDLPDEEILSLISRRRFAMDRDAFGDKIAQEKLKERETARRSGLDLLNSFIEGDQQLGLAGVPEWVGGNASIEDALKKFRRRLEILGVSDEDMTDLEYRLRVEFSEEFSRQNPIEPEPEQGRIGSPRSRPRESPLARAGQAGTLKF